MPRATLSFKLPEEEPEFKDAQEGGKLRVAVYEHDQWLRSRLKYEGLEKDTHAKLQEARDNLRECLSAYDLEIE